MHSLNKVNKELSQLIYTMACKKKIIITKFTNPHLFWFAYQSNDLASTRETIEKKILEHIATIPKLEQGYTPKIGQVSKML